MKKIFIKLVTISLFLAPLYGYAATPLSQQLKGRILLQVESHGEAWYVSPDDGNRIYLKDGATAYGLMRNVGLGITDADLKKIPVGVEKRFPDTDTDKDGLSDNLEEGLKSDSNKWDSDGDGVDDGSEVLVKNTDPLNAGKMYYDYSLVNKLKGKILLQVQSRGEAWYVHPVDGKRYYMKNGDAAYQIMRFLSLGITNSNLDIIPIGQTSQQPTEDNAVAPESSESETPSAPSVEVPLTNAAIIQKVKPAVVYLETAEATGTGFIVESDGYILTNAHVVEGLSAATVKLHDNSSYPAQVVSRNEIKDLALLKISAAGLTPVVLGDSAAVKQGDKVFSFGYPFGIEGEVSFKDGTISRTNTIDDIVYFETSVDIHPGNSGGPLVDQYGKVIGVNTYLYGYTINGVPIGETIKYALPIDTAKEVLPDLKNGVSVYSEADEQVTVELVPHDFNSQLVAIGTQNVLMMELKFTSTYDTPVNITGLTLKVNGIFDGTEIDNCTLSKGNTTLADSNISENNKLIFYNIPLEVPANSSKEISVLVDYIYDETAYLHTIYLTIDSAASVVTDAVVTGDFPLESRTITLLW